MDAAVKIYADPRTRLLRADVYTELASYGIPPGARAADAGSALGAQHLWLSGIEIRLLTEHHVGDHRYFLLTEYEPFGHPGDDEILALHVIIAPIAQTFATRGNWNATLAFAQRWLVAEGCPAERTVLSGKYPHVRNADGVSQGINRRIRDSGSRYRVLGTYTHNDHPLTETWTITEDTLANPGNDPVHVFRETFHSGDGTYRIRDVPCADFRAAAGWKRMHTCATPRPRYPAIPARPAPGLASAQPAASDRRR